MAVSIPMPGSDATARILKTFLLQTIIVGIINLTFTIIAVFTVDRFGRKPDNKKNNVKSERDACPGKIP
ncbi:MAG: MFS transporter [Bacteroidales bacterium]|nr:MFS transporter [Bacteroidales bacterium]